MSSINRKIAEAQGWHVVHDRTGYGDETAWFLVSPAGIKSIWGKQREEEAWSIPGNSVAVPDYENDLNAAWPLLADIPDGGITHHDVSWFIDGHGAEFESLDSPTPQHAALAICKAWLKVKGIE